MTTSLFDLYKIGIGPSSSHTMGPMRAAHRFASSLGDLFSSTERIQVDIYGSLALTGIGHGTDRAVLLGLTGEEASTIDPATIETKLGEIRSNNTIALLGTKRVAFRESGDVVFHRDLMFPPGAAIQHPNGVKFSAFDATNHLLSEQVYFSIGGGFVIADGETAPSLPGSASSIPFPFTSAAELLATAATHGITIAELMLANESEHRSAEEVRSGILNIWHVMRACVERGMSTEGILPGGLNVRRRAKQLAERLTTKGLRSRGGDPLAPLDWVTVYAMAVNEENAAGGRVVTAPTNGAAGVVPAVALYYQNFINGADEDGLLRYFLTSAAIGILYKENASISGAEVGCQGEVGVACSMAAGALVAALGGSNEEIEHAAEIGMEHNLGMTCDPIGGLVQIPCIERNAMGAVKAVHACRMAMNETDGHKISLDQIIRTMYLTGLDMQSRYKETSLAGLALNVIEC
ncbi:L-serine dehydratase, beta subunit [Acidisarcina polymorpha]|uniref:L-serine dehydratase n=1 Tax=Acidisarcina polymorpha TaxID=2211140 RepID=A0A2Z5FXF7_9BACT|nr:L-serine ammonia-lyase [Acidisarcina polymorpha]AXC11065.1 L-serine dehydratase, beta subunit [Acidisarcina polymorpha]